MKRTQVYLLVLALIILTALITAFVFANKQYVSIQRIPIDLEVAGSVAFNLDPDAVHFGKMGPGSTGIRGIILNNTKNVDLVAELSAEGDLANWITVSHQNVEVSANSYRQVNITASVPDGTEFGKYKGTLIVRFKAVDQTTT